MTTIERPIDAAPDAAEPPEVIDLTPERARRPEPAPAPPTARRPASPVVSELRFRRLRLRSMATTAAVFFVLGYITIVGTLVALWNVALALGVVDTVEDSVTTSLGLDEPFTLVGAELFPVVAWGALLLVVGGWVLTMLLTLVYNVAAATFGGLVVEADRRSPTRPRRPLVAAER